MEIYEKAGLRIFNPLLYQLSYLGPNRCPQKQAKRGGREGAF